MVIGLDVHKHSVYAGVVDDKNNRIDEKNMENDIGILTEFLNIYREEDMVIESSTSGKYLAKVLLNLGYRIHLIDPRKIPGMPKNTKKTDREDAFRLAELFRLNALTEIYIPSEEIEDIRSLVYYRRSLGREMTKKKNKISSLLTAYGIIIHATDTFGKRGLREIENNYGKLNKSDKIILRSLLSDIAGIRNREMEIEKEIADISSDNENIKLLMTIPGISFYTAAGIYSVIGDINRFARKDKLASYSGLVPSEYSSGERIVKGHITKQGPSILRFFLVESAHIAIKYTKKFKIKYNKIVKRLGKKRSIVAVARMLIETIYAMLKEGKEFMDIEKDGNSKAVKAGNDKTGNNKICPNDIKMALYYQRLSQMKNRKISRMELASRFRPDLMAIEDITKLIYNRRIKKC